MDLRQLLGKLDLIEGTMAQAKEHPTGPKFTGQWKGTDAGTPGRKLVGDSILKDLSRGPTPKTKEKELAEQFEQFLQALEEESLGVEEKRPLRPSDRPRRDYGKTGEPSKRYTSVKEHEDPWGPEGWKTKEAEADMKAMAAHAKKYPNGDPKVKPLRAKDAVKSAQQIFNKAFDRDETDESRGHKIIATKLGNMERMQNVQIPTPQERQAQLAKQKEEKPKKQVKEYGANQPQGTAGQTSVGQQVQQDPKQAAATNQALTAIKAATGSSAPTTNIAKALDAASQGKPVNQTDMKTLEPMMKDMATVAQDPKLASDFKTLAQKVQQVQQKQQP